MANRKPPSRKAKKPTRPTVIDAEATEIKDPATRPSPPPRQPTSPAVQPARQARARHRNHPHPPAPTTAPAGGRRQDGDRLTRRKPDRHRPDLADSSPAAKKPSGKGKLLTGAFVVALLAGVAAGGYLYREHGAKLFGSTAPAIDVGAVEGQALEAIGTAQSASESAATALASTQSLAEKLNQLEQQLSEARSQPLQPRP